MNQTELNSTADRLITRYDNSQMLEPITASSSEFGVSDAYAVLLEITHRREASGWKRVGRKIGFTNQTIWPRYGVDRPNWAPIWDHTLHRAPEGRTEISLDRFVQPRIEPEVVFGL